MHMHAIGNDIETEFVGLSMHVPAFDTAAGQPHTVATPAAPTGCRSRCSSKPHDLWIDIGATSRAEALALIAIGDAGVLGSTVTHLPNGRIVSRSLDNRIGAFVVLEALRRLAADRPALSVTAVATTQEEIAYTGGGARTSATALAAHAAIVVDVTHATDSPGIEKKRHGEVKLGGGPVLSRGAAVNPVLFFLFL